MIIMYKNLTGRVFQAHFVAEENIWTEEQCEEWNTANPGNTALVVPDLKHATACYYNETTKQLEDSFNFSISASKNTVLDNGTDYAEFSNIPEGTRVNIDDNYIGDVDSSGIFQFTSTEVGQYWIQFEKYGYLEHVEGVSVNAEI